MIELYTAGTPNGRKISIMFEETGLPYRVQVLDLARQEQKQEAYLAINPNGRIPAIVDHDEGDFAVFESGAILIYLAEKTGLFLPSDRHRRSLVLQWLMFQMAAVGPMQGQANVFYRYAPEKIPYAIARYQKETLRLYSVLDRRLRDREFLADALSIADFATYPWVHGFAWAGIDLEGLPHLQRWLSQLAARPAVQRGMMVPTAPTSPDVHTLERIEAGRSILV